MWTSCGVVLSFENPYRSLFAKNSPFPGAVQNPRRGRECHRRKKVQGVGRKEAEVNRPMVRINFPLADIFPLFIADEPDAAGLMR
jgi:hypothetical protein